MSTSLNQSGIQIVYLNIDKKTEKAEKILSAVSERASQMGCKKAVILPNAHVCNHSSRVKGVVYVVDGSASPKPIVEGIKDMCSGVTAFDIQSFPADAVNREEEYVAERFSKISSSALHGTPFFDRSIDSVNSDEKISLGEAKSSVSLMKSVPTRESGTAASWIMVVRTYSDTQSKFVLHEASEEGATVQSLVQSDAYEKAVRYGCFTRCAVAASLADWMGLTVKTVTGRFSPKDVDFVEFAEKRLECLYNVFEDVPTSSGGTSGSKMYAFFDGCYPLGSVRSEIALFKDAGKSLIIFKGKPSSISKRQARKAENAFPMEFPKEVTSVKGAWLKNAAGVYWGGKTFLHPDLLDTSPSNWAAKHSKQWYACLEKLGLDAKDGYDEYDMVVSYVSTCNESAIDTKTIIEQAPEGAYVFLPIDHDIIQKLVKSYKKIKKAWPDISMDLFFNEIPKVRGYTKIHIKNLQKLHDTISEID